MIGKIIGLGIVLSLMIWIVVPLLSGDKNPTKSAGQKGGKSTNPITTAKPIEAIGLVLSICHGEKLKSASEMANAMVYLYHSEDDKFDKDDIMLAAGRLMKIRRASGNQELRRADDAWAYDLETRKSKRIEGEKDLARLDQFQSLIRASLLEPLYDAESAVRLSETSFSITTRSGESWQLELGVWKPEEGEERAELLLPTSLSSSHGKVRFTRYRYHGFNNLPGAIAIKGFGEWRFLLSRSGVTWDPAVFKPRGVASKPKPKPGTTPKSVPKSKSAPGPKTEPKPKKKSEPTSKPTTGK